jgi:hypothetical protein
MTSLTEIVRNYPILSVLLIVGPLMGGIIGTYLGYDNLSARLQNERQQDRIEGKAERIRGDLEKLSVPIETLRRYESSLGAAGQNGEVLKRLIAQYDQLKRAITVREQFNGRFDLQERISAADHILSELRALIGETKTIGSGPSEALLIKTGPNTFRVTFAVPMRIPPNLTFQNIPKGSDAHVIEKTTIGFTVVFTPSSIAVDTFGFVASAQL